jgi:tetratricopeptide (TPR) repeat protein
MIGIFAPTELHEEINKAIARYDRMHELVNVLSNKKEADALPDGNIISIKDKMILCPPDWFQSGPPIWFPPISYSPSQLAGLVFVKLHNFEEAHALLVGQDALWAAVQQYAILLHEYSYQPLPSQKINDFYACFNHAICLHYALHENPPALEEILNAYDQALMLAVEPPQQVYTVVQMATLLTDSGMAENAVNLASRALEQNGLNTHAVHALKWQRCQAWLQMLEVPYNNLLLEQLKNNLWEVLEYFEAYNRKTEQGLLLIDATHIANISESFAEALGYINKAIQLLETEQLPELAANAQLKKGLLLFTWAQKAQPQFFRPAKDALLAALQIFSRDAAPHVFADIHHYLGIVYSEIPDEVQKKSVWAGISVSSFQEALNFYNKVDYPYEFAQICHHFANAFTKYPAAALGDNFEKALNWYNEALSVRTPDAYPLERSLTLSNYLDAAWKAGNPGDGWNEDRWNDMWEKASELRELSMDEALQQEAQGWMDVLVKAKAEV